MTANESLLLDTKDVAALLKCSTRHVSRLEARGEIPKAVRLGAAVRWPRQAMEDWVAQGCPKGAIGEQFAA